ncbi:acyltransferase [Pseudomonas sp. LS44]|uniref:acyltransferase family protein n=1 Tax=Pseudomonas sp. LS44 TaxID=1357074 RepID=UPI00215AE670|nr:acyltransferase [Pseudomonas sp. LS44]UVE17947.1 acyltransferase [Pseudomonas sp. LS44]
MAATKNMEIEYLRAVAIGLTLLSHLPNLLPFHQELLNSLFRIYMPWTGVDLFFCISGYVVSKAYLDSFDQHRQQGRFWLAAQSFWIRRIYRLLPTAWLWVLIPLVLSICFNESKAFGTWYENLQSITAVITFSGNLANQYNMILGPNSVYWSLALEEQFYFIFPLFLLLVTTVRWRVAILLLLIAVQFCFDRNPFANSVTAMAASFRLDAMMWGILICLFSRTATYRQFEPVFLSNSPLKVLGLNLLLLYMLGAISAQMMAAPIAVGLIAMVSAMLVFMASFNSGYIMSVPLVSPALEWLGSRSYGIYVIHFPAYRISQEIWHRYAQNNNIGFNGGLTMELLLTAAFFIIVLSELNYRLIEQPLRKKGAEIARRRLRQEPGEVQAETIQPLLQR